MILTLKNNEGLIYSYFEWDIVRQNGQRDANGEYMYVRDIWVHDKYDGGEAIRQFIALLDADGRNLNVKWIYWLRDDVRLSKAFNRNTCLRRIYGFYKN